jgi:hypothetical protein
MWMLLLMGCSLYALLQAVGSNPARLAKLLSAFPACVARDIQAAVTDSQQSFTSLVLTKLDHHKASKVYGQENFQELCR